jgi:hypothetical protein
MGEPSSGEIGITFKVRKEKDNIIPYLSFILILVMDFKFNLNCRKRNLKEEEALADISAYMADRLTTVLKRAHLQSTDFSN